MSSSYILLPAEEVLKLTEESLNRIAATQKKYDDAYRETVRSKLRARRKWFKFFLREAVEPTEEQIDRHISEDQFACFYYPSYIGNDWAKRARNLQRAASLIYPQEFVHVSIEDMPALFWGK